MSDRGLPPDASLACPFVALEDDRDARSTRPDHRHRCFAELRPAPRAVAHQEAYCLSPGFAACPTFVDWARREAARARPTSETSAAEPRAAMPPPPIADRSEPARDPEVEPWPRREPHRDWAAPPPWAESAAAAGAAGAAGGQAEPPEPFRAEPSEPITPPPAVPDPEVEAPSFLASYGNEPPHPPPPSRPRTIHDAVDPDDELEAGQIDESGWAELESEEPQMRRFGPAGGRSRYDDTSASASPATGKSAPPRRRPPADPDAPSWEKPRRQEAYPTLRTRAGLSGVSPLLGVGLVIVLAAGALFFIPPMLLGLGGSGASPGPTASGAAASATPEASPTPIPAPTPIVYVVKSGDTLIKIAKTYGVTLDALIAANKETLPDPDKLQIGDQLIIPLGDAEPTLEAPSPSP